MKSNQQHRWNDNCSAVIANVSLAFTFAPLRNRRTPNRRVILRVRWRWQTFYRPETGDVTLYVSSSSSEHSKQAAFNVQSNLQPILPTYCVTSVQRRNCRIFLILSSTYYF